MCFFLFFLKPLDSLIRCVGYWLMKTLEKIMIKKFLSISSLGKLDGVYFQSLLTIFPLNPWLQKYNL